MIWGHILLEERPKLVAITTNSDNVCEAVGFPTSPLLNWKLLLHISAYLRGETLKKMTLCFEKRLADPILVNPGKDILMFHSMESLLCFQRRGDATSPSLDSYGVKTIALIFTVENCEVAECLYRALRSFGTVTEIIIVLSETLVGMYTPLGAMTMSSHGMLTRVLLMGCKLELWNINSLAERFELPKVVCITKGILGERLGLTETSITEIMLLSPRVGNEDW
jgi:hypothetical protein